MSNGSPSIDQSLFEEAIKEVSRLEKLLVPRKELTPDVLSGASLFEKIDVLTPSITTWEKVLDDAIRIERKPSFVSEKPKVEKPKLKVVTEEERLAKEREEIEKMKAKFAALEKEMEKEKAPLRPPEAKPEEKALVAKPEEKPVAFEKEMEKEKAPLRPPEAKPEEKALVAKPEEKPVALEKEMEKEKAPLRPPEAKPEEKALVAKPEERREAAPSEVSLIEQKRMEEELRLMRERLSHVLQQQEQAGEQKVVQPQPKPAEKAAAQRPSRTLYEILEKKKGIEEVKPAETAPPATTAKPLPETQAKRISALKEELAEKVRRKKEEEEKKKRIEELRKELEESEDS